MMNMGCERNQLYFLPPGRYHLSNLRSRNKYNVVDQRFSSCYKSDHAVMHIFVFFPKTEDTKLYLAVDSMLQLPSAVLIFVGVQLLFGPVLQANVGNSCLERYPCQQEKHNRTILYCPDICEKRIDFEKHGCQNCRSEPYWMCSGQYHRRVDIEYFFRGGIGKATYVDDNHHFNISMLRHTGSWLAEIPGNICDIFDLVKIDLRKNRINVLKQLACLKVLDTLILSHNLISYISNDTFLDMPELRVLDLSNNLIEYLEPNSLTGPSIGIMHMNFDNNILKTVDATNIVLAHSFCTLSYSDNKIFEIVNEVGWKFNKTKNYGYGGYVDLSTNAFQSWPDFTIFGLDNLSNLYKIFGYGLDFRNVNFSCDCKMTPFLKLTEDAIRKIWRDYYNVTCSNPESLRGQSIPQLVLDKKLDLFICDIPRGNAGRCPDGCKCFELSSQNATVVNCSNTNKTSLPDHLPRNRTNFVLDFSRNEIKYLESKSYFASTVNLTLESNSISEIKFNAFKDAEKMTLLTLNDNNGISNLPKSLQRLDPCQISLGTLILHCHCDILWIAEWANGPKSSICEGQNNISCKTSGGEILPIASWTRENLECPNESQLTMYMYFAVLLAVLSFAVVFTSYLIHRFKYDIYLTICRITQKKEIHVYCNDGVLSFISNYVVHSHITCL